ncbi:hypothetical protein V9T40_000514 [Parthenolecanium corni]|uniref:HTH CENPB-type domain-containing protein n=1 Tax=Parthenolecanium corni TaxID=536013 RepID=A0AAN9T9X3_9HEMI
MTSKVRRQFTLEEKFSIISRLENGESNSSLVKEFSSVKSTISTIWKNRESIKNDFLKRPEGQKRLRSSNCKPVEDALLVWFKQQRALHIPISGPILLEKANQFGKLLQVENFSCSASWIQRFRQRNNIVFGKISGESAAVDSNVCSTWLSNVWPLIRAGYTDDQIYNADEAGIFYKLTPDKTLRLKNENCSGGKLSRERITVLVAANMNGSDKRKLLVIGKSKNPRCFKNVTSLPVTYTNNTKAWMTSAIFEEMLQSWDNELRRSKKKILLLVDNCPAHPDVKLNFIRLVFLPPNTTALLQPMDQGVIRNLKANYRKLLVLKIIENIDEKRDSKITTLDAILMLNKAWSGVSTIAIANCFRHAGLNEADAIISTSDAPDNEPISNLVSDEYISIDDDVVTSEIQSDNDIVSSILNEAEDKAEAELETAEEEFGDPPSITEARKALHTLEAFFLTRDTAVQSELNALKLLDNSVQKNFFKHIKSKQTHIQNYFSPV